MGNPTPIEPMGPRRACRGRLYRAAPRHRTAPVVGLGATNLLLVTFLISVSAILLGTSVALAIPLSSGRRGRRTAAGLPLGRRARTRPDQGRENRKHGFLPGLTDQNGFSLRMIPTPIPSMAKKWERGSTGMGGNSGFSGNSTTSRPRRLKRFTVTSS